MTKKIPVSFSNVYRDRKLSEFQSAQFDLVIIGGGITGAGIALDAALRGLKTLVIEKSDFASGTSSKSTKLIHGGLRYLKQLEFGLVRETGLERAVAHENVCHLVHPESMLLPIVDKGTFGALSAGLAISVYDRLANVKDKYRKKNLNKEEISSKEPLIRKDILKSGIQYSEYRTDDARLTIEILKSARRNGAEAINYLEVTDYIYTKNKITGVVCNDAITGTTFKIKAKSVVSAAGPWVDHLNQIEDKDADSNLRLSKGIHIVIDRKRLPLNNAVYFDVFDGRMIFAIPRHKVVYVGTTDTFYNDDLDDIRCTREDVDYIIKAVNNLFDLEADLNLYDVQSTWAGLRPLIKKKGRGPSELSRKDEIFVSDGGLITIAGGKLTGFRKMAERVVDLVLSKLKKKDVECSTKEYKIHHNPYLDYNDYLKDIVDMSKTWSNYDKDDITFLVSSFGKDAQLILENCQSKHNGNLIKSLIQYTIDHEAVMTPLDFIERRTGWLYFDVNKVHDHADEIYSTITEVFNLPLAWSDTQIEKCNNVISINTLEDMKKDGA